MRTESDEPETRRRGNCTAMAPFAGRMDWLWPSRPAGFREAAEVGLDVRGVGSVGCGAAPLVRREIDDKTCT